MDNRASSTQAFKTTIFARIVSGNRVTRDNNFPWSNPIGTLLYGHPIVPPVRTPHYGQFALFLGRESSYIFSQFNRLTTDTFYAPLRGLIVSFTLNDLFSRQSTRDLSLSYCIRLEGSQRCFFDTKDRWKQSSSFCKLLYCVVCKRADCGNCWA